MTERIQHWLRKLLESFWLTPLLITLAGGLAGIASVKFDGTDLARSWADDNVLLAITVDGGRSLVSTVAAGIVTMASLVFSLMFVALTLASQQLGPRLIQMFMRDRFAKFAFGSFTGAFLFCLVVLAVTGTGEKGNFVPVFSVLLVVAVAVGSFSMMLIYIHRVAGSIQADKMIAQLGDLLVAALEDDRDRQSAPAGEGACAQEASPASDEAKKVEAVQKAVKKNGGEVITDMTGYVASINGKEIVATLEKYDLRGVSPNRPGHFITSDMALLLFTGDLKDADRESFCEKIREAISIEDTRSVSDAGEFEVHALVEVALRALSPGINDSYTAVACIDQLTQALGMLLKTRAKHRIVLDSKGTARLVLHNLDFRHFLKSAYYPIRHAARDNPLVLSRLINAFRLLLASDKADGGAKQAICEQLAAIQQTVRSNVSTKDDKEYLSDLADKAMQGAGC